MGSRRKTNARPQKKRVAFRSNRAKPARDKNWTRRAHADGAEELDTHGTERVVAKGDLSRKRTVMVGGDASQPTDPNTRAGVVITIFGAVALVDDGGRVWPCSLRRVLRTLDIRNRNAVVVGDHVQFTVFSEREGVEAEGVIESVEPRHGELTRVARQREHTIVANVDQAVIISAASVPTPKWHLVDRYIISALYGGIAPVVCLNKIDEADPDDVRFFLEPYDRLGYTTLATSAVTGQGADALREALAGKSSVFAGQSGVGKSSLLNCIQPGLHLAVGKVVCDTLKGRHTTARATLLKLDVGGFVVDTPGVKAFDISCVPRAEFERCFVEFLPHIPHCKFPDCTHVHEDKCAVRDAVARGHISPERYDSYVRLFTDEQLR